jgi:hypothetical protein
MSTDYESDRYQAYLLRLWRAQHKGQWQWRVTIESPGTGERHGFGTLAELFIFLKDQTHQETLPGEIGGQDVNPASVPNMEEETHDVQK